MIVRKTWYSRMTIQQYDDKTGKSLPLEYSRYRWEGWFLFGLIPLYIIRYG
jgi:hypothetical protein